MKILLAIDGSPHSDAAVFEVCRRPWPAESEIRLITVDAPITPPLIQRGEADAFCEMMKQLRAEAIRRLHAAVTVFKDSASELHVTSVLREGSPKNVILDEAEQWGADLIVVGSNGYGAVQRLFLGSVSLAIATNATCSVEIVRILTAKPSGSEP